MNALTPETVGTWNSQYVFYIMTSWSYKWKFYAPKYKTSEPTPRENFFATFMRTRLQKLERKLQLIKEFTNDRVRKLVEVVSYLYFFPNWQVNYFHYQSVKVHKSDIIFVQSWFFDLIILNFLLIGKLQRCTRTISLILAFALWINVQKFYLW